MNLEKVIRIIDELIFEAQKEPTWKTENALRCLKKELLKEQEAKPVIQDRQCEVEPNVWERKGFCPKCHQIVLYNVNRLFCGFCGQAVKWYE